MAGKHEKIRVGLCGFHRGDYMASVARVHQFYLHALSSAFEIYDVDDPSDQPQPKPDAVVDFRGSLYGQQSRHLDFPLLMGLLGSIIFHQDFLRTHVGNLETTDVLLVNCRSDVAILQRIFAEDAPNICYLPLPGDTAAFHRMNRDDCIASLEIGQPDLTVGFVGRLIPPKNVHQFLRIFSELKRRLRGRRLAGIVVSDVSEGYPFLSYLNRGYNHYLIDLQRQLGLEEDVHFFDLPVKRSDDQPLALCYGAMDVLIHPTNVLDENFGYVPVEAMACGVPVVGAAYGGLKDTVLSGQTGFLMPTWITKTGIRMDLISGVDAAVRLLSDSALRQRMSEACVERVQKHYSYGAFADTLCSAVRHAVEQRRMGKSQRIAPPPPRPLPETDDEEDEGLMMPYDNLPWEQFRNVVVDYASIPQPKLNPSSRLRLAAPLRREDEGVYRLDDPTWPAIFRLDKSDLNVLRRCDGEVAHSELEERLGPAAKRIQHFLEMGLLIGSGLG